MLQFWAGIAISKYIPVLSTTAKRSVQFLCFRVIAIVAIVVQTSEHGKPQTPKLNNLLAHFRVSPTTRGPSHMEDGQNYDAILGHQYNLQGR